MFAHHKRKYSESPERSVKLSAVPPNPALCRTKSISRLWRKQITDLYVEPQNRRGILTFVDEDYVRILGGEAVHFSWTNSAHSVRAIQTIGTKYSQVNHGHLEVLVCPLTCAHLHYFCTLAGEQLCRLTVFLQEGHPVPQCAPSLPRCSCYTVYSTLDNLHVSQ